MPDALYEITSQAPMTKLQPNGDTLEGIEIWFTITGLNVSGSVFVPGNPPNPTLAKELIAEYVQRSFVIAGMSE